MSFLAATLPMTTEVVMGAFIFGGISVLALAFWDKVFPLDNKKSAKDNDAPKPNSSFELNEPAKTYTPQAQSTPQQAICQDDIPANSHRCKL